MDREEAQHVMRALETRTAAFGPARSLGVLFKARLDQAKPWYGWPYYLAVATVWRVFRSDYDVGVLANLLFLAVAAFCTAGVARRLGGEEAGPPAAVSLILTPGILIWSHLFSPTVFLVAAFAATALAILAAEAWSRPGTSLAAGLLAAGTSVAKMSLVFGWLALVLYVSRPLLTPEGRRRARPGAVLFILGLLPLPLSVWINRGPLSFWATQARALYQQESASVTLVGVVLRTFEVFLPFHLILGLLGLLLLSRTPAGRRLAGFLGIWAALPALGVVLFLGNSGTTRDHALAALPLAIIAGAGLATLGPRPRAGLVAAMLLYAAVLIPVNLFGAGVGLLPPAGRFGWLHTNVDGVPWGVRLAPYPDLVDATVARLRALVPPGTQGRCDCLPAPPYPLANAAGRPVVALDSRLLGPENLDATFMLRGESDPWQVGYVPYPLSCAPFQVAEACTSVIVYAPPPLAAEFPAAEDRVAPRRALLGTWGRSAGEIDVPEIGRVAFRLAAGPPLCSLAGPEAAAAWQRAAAGCPENDYYALLIGFQFGGAPLEPAQVKLARALTRARQAELQANGDTPALIFGEGYLVQWTLDALDRLAPETPASTRR
ncbi:MAG: hypothetical protein QOF89_5191 [Acidobacteriota bacterium]|nr:hypothetical protein [Acidobacteriota bacterium]